MKLSLLEQETIILYNRAENEATVYTHEPTLKRKLAEMEKGNNDVQLIRADYGSVEYTIPKKLVSIRKPMKKKTMTEEEKQHFSEIFRKKERTQKKDEK